MALNQFPVRVPIGRAIVNGQNVDVLMTAEFSRAITAKPEQITGSISDGTALQSLLRALVNLGLVTDTTTP